MDQLGNGNPNRNWIPTNLRCHQQRDTPLYYAPLRNKTCSHMGNPMEEHYRQLRHPRVPFSGGGQTRNKLTTLKETTKNVHFSSLWQSEEKSKTPRRTATASTQPVWHKETSGEFDSKQSKAGSVLRWLSQISTNPQIPSARTSLQASQILYICTYVHIHTHIYVHTPISRMVKCGEENVYIWN